jgi:hypothetical protein
MKHYTDRDNNSNVMGYDYGDDWIVVYFKDNSKYTYTSNSAGMSILKRMQHLADYGDGLNSFISSNKPGYASKS